ncbi:MAG: KOW motif-containing protein [Chloroflexota bacterium]
MTFASSTPEQRYIIPLTTLRREISLPPDVQGVLMVVDGQRVDGNTIVARGYPPARHHILDAAGELRLRRRQPLADYLFVETGDTVDAEQVLASKSGDTDRGRRVFSPVSGVVVSIDETRIVVREHAEQIELIAGMAGEVVKTVAGRGVVVETSGAVIQGVWGNGERRVGALKIEPSQGMEFIEGGQINLEWRGSIVVTRRPLTPTNFVIMEEQDIAGVIAPSMDSTLTDLVRQSDRAVLLTEGFGDAAMTKAVFTMFEELAEKYLNVRATLDAIVPGGIAARRPEVFISVPVKKGEEPRMLKPTASFRKGARVRITRAPYAGQTGIILELPVAPQIIGNGLRVPSAMVETAGGEHVAIPLANLEFYTA